WGSPILDDAQVCLCADTNHFILWQMPRSDRFLLRSLRDRPGAIARILGIPLLTEPAPSHGRGDARRAEAGEDEEGDAEAAQEGRVGLRGDLPLAHEQRDDHAGSR